MSKCSGNQLSHHCDCYDNDKERKSLWPGKINLENLTSQFYCTHCTVIRKRNPNLILTKS